MICMKKTFNVDDALLKEAKVACGAGTDTELSVWASRPWYAMRLTSVFGASSARSLTLETCPGGVRGRPQNAGRPDGSGGHLCMDSVSCRAFALHGRAG